VQFKIVDIDEKNFDQIPRPANKKFNCQECFYWMGKRDGRQDLVKQKKNWFVRQGKRHGGSLGKLLLRGKREMSVGFIQFGPIAELDTVKLFYTSKLRVPRNGWAITCIAIQSSYRGKGLATRLVRNVMRDLKRRGVKTIDAYPLKTTRSWNQVAAGPVGLFEKCGFEKVAPIKGIEKRFLMRRKKW
jgi:ribosomal protein S18 acetylase RimI-like enzyme